MMNFGSVNDLISTNDGEWLRWNGSRINPLPPGTLVKVRFPDLGEFGPWPAQTLLWDMIDEYKVVPNGRT